MWEFICLVVAVCFFALLDGWYWLRVPLVVLRAKMQPVVRDLLSEQVVGGRVLISDLDPLMHMNNARYLREADFARFSFLTRCGMFGAMRALGARFVMASSAARYRRSLRLLEPFQVRTRILCWDERAFYVEQRFVSPGDGRVCAVVLSCQHVLRSSPDKVMQYLAKRQLYRIRLALGQRFSYLSDQRISCVEPVQQKRLKNTLSNESQVESPEFPEEVQHWISYNDTSSKNLRAESGINDEKEQ